MVWLKTIMAVIAARTAMILERIVAAVAIAIAAASAMALLETKVLAIAKVYNLLHINAYSFSM